MIFRLPRPPGTRLAPHKDFASTPSRRDRMQKPKSESKIADYKIFIHPISVEKRIERFPTGGGTQITKGFKI